MKQEIAENFRACILENFPWAAEREFSDQDDLYEKGIIDSLGFLNIVTFMEKEYDIQVSEEDIVPENFSSVQGMTNYISRKLQTAEISPGESL